MVNVDMSESGVDKWPTATPGWRKDVPCKIANMAVTSININKLTFLGARELRPGVAVGHVATPDRCRSPRNHWVLA